MLIVVIVLVITNLACLAALVRLYLQPIDVRGPDPTLAAALDANPTIDSGGVRRLVSIEILNPVELAGTRGRLAALAGTLVPRLTRRIVYDQTVKILKDQLVEQHVVADVRVHTLRPPRTARVEVLDTVERPDLGPATGDPEH